VTFVTGGVERAVELAKTAAGTKNVSIFGASVDQECLRLGLVDEIVVHVVLLLLSEGIRLFENLGDHMIELERTEAISTAEFTSFRFRVVK
jgi:dihydrofolate reductase